MPTEFQQSIAPNGGQEHWMIQHLSHVRTIILEYIKFWEFARKSLDALEHPGLTIKSMFIYF